MSKVGEKIMSGDFNLTRISFPIQCMSHNSALETMVMVQTTMPVYLNYASSITDPVERMKLVMTSSFCSTIYEKFYYKPLNPILGETFEAEGQDGSKIYCEQTSHHPPVSHIIVDGPEDNYKMTGYLEYEVSSGIRSASVTCKGHKEVTFKDGGKVRFGQCDDLIYGIMMGSFGHQLVGTVEYEDKANNLTGYI